VHAHLQWRGVSSRSSREGGMGVVCSDVLR
jgi:hypothetical protein